MGMTLLAFVPVVIAGLALLVLYVNATGPNVSLDCHDGQHAACEASGGCACTCHQTRRAEWQSVIDSWTTEPTTTEGETK